MIINFKNSSLVLPPSLQMELMEKFTKSGKKRKAKSATQSAPKRQLVVTDDDEQDRQVAPRQRDSAENQNEVNSEYNLENSEGYSDSDDNIIDNILNDDQIDNRDSVENNDNNDNSPPSPSMISAKADDIFCQDYISQTPVHHSQLVSEALATTLTGWCRNPPKKDNLGELFKNAMTPINVEGLMPVRINDGLYHKLQFKARINDQRLCGLNAFIVCSCGPLASVFQELCTSEMALKSYDEKTQVEVKNDGTLFVGNTVVDFTQMCKSLGVSLQLLASCDSYLFVRHKVSLLPFLDKRFHYLTRDTNPVTTLLLGSDLEQKISDLMKVSDVAQKLTLNRQPRSWFV